MALRNQGMAGTAATTAASGGMDQMMGQMNPGLVYNQVINGPGGNAQGIDFQNLGTASDWNMAQFDQPQQQQQPKAAGGHQQNPQASPRMMSNNNSNAQMVRPPNQPGGPAGPYPTRPPYAQMTQAQAQAKAMQMQAQAQAQMQARMASGTAGGGAGADQYPPQNYPMGPQGERARAASLNLQQPPPQGQISRSVSQGTPQNFSPNATGVMMSPSPMNSGSITPPIASQLNQGGGQGPLSHYPGVVYQQSLQAGGGQPMYRPGMKGPGGIGPAVPPNGANNFGPMSPPMSVPAHMAPQGQMPPGQQQGPLNPAMPGAPIRRPSAPMLPPSPPQWLGRSQIHPGACVMKLTHFSDLMNRRPESNSIDFWTKLIGDFFALNGVMKYALWNSAFHENRTFELNTPLIARFYKVNFDSNVRQINLLMGNPKEYLLSNGLVLVDCPRAELTYVFDDELRVIALGHLRVTFLPNLRIQIWEFHTNRHYEMLPRSLLMTYWGENDVESQEDLLDERTKIMLPPTTLNEFGITVQTMRCLEIAEVVCHMRELMAFSEARQLGPIESLQQYPAKITEMLRKQSMYQQPGTPGNQMGQGPPQQQQQGPPTPNLGMNPPNTNITSPGYATPGSFMGGGFGFEPASSPAANVNEVPPSPSGVGVAAAGKAAGKRSPKDGPGSPEGTGKTTKKAKTTAAAPAATTGKKKAPAKGKKVSPSPSPKG